MFKRCPCTLRVTKKSYWLFIVFALTLVSPQVEAQSAASIITLPRKPMTYEDALQIIGKELGVHVGYIPPIAELKDSCTHFGKMTFNKFFEPLKALGLSFLFKTDNYGIIKHLIIIAPSPARKMLRIWAQEAETGYPLPGVTVKNVTTGKIAFTDISGMACFPYDNLPVDLLLTYVGRKTLFVTVRQDSMPIPLEIDAESLGAATVSAAPVKKAFATLTSSTLVIDHRVNSSYRSTRRLPGVSSSTVQTMLEGQMPGVLTTSTTGVPGGSSYVSVRGQASIVNGIDPYYIIDGVPSAAGNASVSYMPSGIASASLSSWTFTAPGNIERVDVLRDADATAIYGSRGANGVVLITTRRWRAGLPKWDVEVSTGTSMVMRQPAFLNTPEYLTMRREALQNSGLPDSTAPDLTGPDTARNFNWGKWLLGRQARCANVKFAVSGGQSKNSYTVGMNYFREATPFPTQPDHDRLTTDFNYNHRSVDRRWTLQLAGLAGWDANHQFISLDPSTFRATAPVAPSMLTPSGGLNFSSSLFNNPLAQIRQPYQAFSGNYLLSLVNSYALSDHLFWKTTAGFNRTQTSEFGAMPLADQPPSSGPTATGYFSNTRFDSRIFEPQMEYRRQDGKLLTSLLCGASLQGWDEHAAARTDTGYANDIALLHHQHAVQADTSTQAARGNYSGLFTNLNANLDGRYILNVTARRDESSRFPEGHRSAGFGSVAFAWILSDAEFFNRLFPFVSYGKLRATSGVTGNNQIGDRSLQFVSGTSIQSFQSIAGFYPSTPPDMGWEKTYKSELSLDLGFWQNRILFNATAYRHRSTNFFEGNGFQLSRFGSGKTGWVAVLENSGYELSLTATVADKNYFGWDIAANWTIPRNKLVSFPQLASSGYAGRLIVGQSINVLSGYVYKGVDRQTGLFSFADLDGDGKITPADQKVVGKFDVTGFGGFENTVRWRQFQFQLLIDVRLATGLNYLTPVFANNPPGTFNNGFSSNVPRVLLDHWRKPGDRAAYQEIYAAPNANADSARQRYLSSSALLANTSFMRLRKLSIVYDLPAAGVAAMHLSSLELFADAQNLLVLSPYKADPEIQSVLTLPTMRTIEIGVRISH